MRLYSFDYPSSWSGRTMKVNVPAKNYQALLEFFEKYHYEIDKVTNLDSRNHEFTNSLCHVESKTSQHGQGKKELETESQFSL